MQRTAKIEAELAELYSQSSLISQLSEMVESIRKITVDIYAMNPKADVSLFDSLRACDVMQMKIESQHQQKVRSLELLSSIQVAPNDLLFTRIIIGAGTAATLLFSELPPEYRNTNSSHVGLPGVLILNDPNKPHTWPKEGTRLMGQPSAVQTPPIFSTHAADFNLQMDHDAHNPYQYVAAKDFTDAITANQSDLGMRILQVGAKRIESFDVSRNNDINNPDWEFPEAKHRVVVELDGQTKYFYANSIDLCSGLGDSQRLSAEQVDPVLSEKLIAENKLVYANEGDGKLSGNVVFYGGSAVNAAWIAEIILNNAQPGTTVQCLVSRRNKPLDDTPNLNRLIDDVCKTGKVKMMVGGISQVKKTETGLAVTFSESESTSKYHNLAGQTLFCDQLVVGVGPGMHDLVKKFEGFVVCMDESGKVPLGTHSADKSIIAWGAAGSIGIGLTDDERLVITRLNTIHADSTLVENNALGGISRSSWTIEQMAIVMRKHKVFPSDNKYQPHKNTMLRINQATEYEMAKVFEVADRSLSFEICLSYARDVIKERLKVPEKGSFEPTGIHSPERLKPILPEKLFIAAVQTYFPFNLPQRAKRMPTPEPVRKTYQALSWLNSNKKTPDAKAFVADVVDEENKEEVSPVVTTPQTIKVGT